MTMMDAIKFVIRYRGRKAFVDWSIPQIILAIHDSIIHNTFCHVEEEGKITGLMVGHITETKFHVTNILCIKRNMPVFISFILRNHPSITSITTLRHGRFFKEYQINETNYKRFMKGTK